MCYDISFTVDLPQLKDYFPELVFDDQLSLDFSNEHIIAHAFGQHPIVYRDSEGVLHCRAMEWGCIPFYVKEEKAFAKSRNTMLNARSERILEDSKSYWFKIRNRRCLIPVTGFFEHREIKGWKKKVPYFIRLTKQPMFFIPGLYSVAELPDLETGEVIRRYTYTLITRNANELMRKIHNGGDNKYRMPLLLPFEMSMGFLEPELSPDNYKAVLDFEMPPDEMSSHAVFTIRSPKGRPDEKAKMAPWDWEQLPALGELDPN